MAATVGTQAVPNTGSSMLVQLLESQRLENNVEVLAEGEETSVNDEVSLPTPLAFYDFEEESADVTFKHFGSGVAPYSVPLSEMEKGLQFTGSDTNNMGYIQIANPFKGKSEITTQGATISLWVYLSGSSANNSVWGFSRGLDGYENLPILGYEGSSYLTYNNNGRWIDFNRTDNPSAVANPVQSEQMAMLTFSFGTDALALYVNGEVVTYPITENVASLVDLLTDMQSDTFSYFCVGKGSWTGTFSGRADKLGFYDKALTADEVKALYDSQKDGYENLKDLSDFAETEDVTSLITNADFSNADNVTEGWEVGMGINSELSATAGLIVHDNGGDQWTGDFYQIIENVPTGIYTLSAQIATRADWSIDLYANDKVTGVGEKNSNEGSPDAVYDTWTDQNINRYSVSNVVVTDGTLRIGVRKTNQRAGWLCFDNFRLEKVSLNDILVLYANVKADAQAVDQSLLPENLKARLNTAMAEPSEYKSDAYSSAYFSLQTVVELCNAYISECPIETLIETCEAYSENSVSTSATKATFDAAIAAAEAVDLSTVDINGLREAYNALEAARQAFAQNAVPTGEQEFDMTWLLTNPEVSNLAVGYQNGWYCYINKFNFVVADNHNQAGETGFNKFFECFEWNSLGTGWAIYQKATVPQGSYKMTVAAFAARSSNASTAVDATTPKLALYVGDTRGTEVTSTVLSYGSVEFIQTETQEVYLGVKVEDGNQINWCGLNDMKLYKVHQEATDLSLNETDVAYEVAAGTFANVTLTRTLKSESWNTFCVPFGMTAEQLAANGITDVRALESASVEGTSVTLNFSESNLNAVEAGVPYLVKVDASYDGTINVENVLVSAAEPTTVSVEGGVSMTGNYAAGNVPTGAYFISDNAFYYADVETVVLKGFRAYINVNGTSEAAGANRLMINLDGEVTGIEDVLGEEAAEADKLVNVVSLDGMTVKAGVKKAEALDGLQKGIYIVDGKKYVVK